MPLRVLTSFKGESVLFSDKVVTFVITDSLLWHSVSCGTGIVVGFRTI